MRVHRIGIQVVTLLVASLLLASPVQAQSSASAQGQAQAASRVNAELVKGKLNPATSKPGDQVVVRTKDDVRSNGQVVLKKGTEITGVVRNAKRAEKADKASTAQSMMQVEWLMPASSGASSQELNFALQSIAYTNPLYAHQEAESSAPEAVHAPPPASAATPRPSSGGGLPGGGLVGNVTSSTTATVVGVTGGAAATSVPVRPAVPAVVPVSSQTAASLQNSLGVSGNTLFATGHGQATSAGGTASSIDIFSQMSNDAVITSPSRDFEIGSGAQMQFMVSGRRQQ